MRDRMAELEGAVVALVTFTRARNLRGYRSRFGLPYTVLADETRSAYRAYGLRRGTRWQVWGPATMRAYVGLAIRGARIERPKEDTAQLGGDFVVDGRGRLAFVHRASSPADQPPIDALVAAVAGHAAS